MNCIMCNKSAVATADGVYFCKKHWEERNNSVERRNKAIIFKRQVIAGVVVVAIVIGIIFFIVFESVGGF